MEVVVDNQIPKSRSSWIKWAIYLCVGAICVGTALRIGGAFRYSQIYGDVNLIALTAREFAGHNRIYYPMKWEFRPEVPYLALSSPATQHPPLLPLVTGLIAKVFRTDQTFVILKIISCCAGLLFLLLCWRLANVVNGRETAVVAVSASALCPALVLYSYNGSVYILLGCAVSAVAIKLIETKQITRAQAMLLGSICGCAVLLHTNMISLVAAIAAWFFIKRKNYRPSETLIFGLTFVAFVAPLIIWNLVHFGKPFASYAKVHLAFFNGFVVPDISPEGVYLREVTMSFREKTNIYLSKVFVSAMQSGAKLLEIYGILTTALAAAGLWVLWRKNRSAFITFGLLLFFQFAVFGFLGVFRDRFLLPVAALLFVLAGITIAALAHLKGAPRKVAAALWLCMVFEHSLNLWVEWPTLWLENDRKAIANGQMRQLAQRMTQELPPGLVLGSSRDLDGGMETVYWTKWPYVYGRWFYGPALTSRLVKDFKPDYIWVEWWQSPEVQRWVPEFKPVLQNAAFVVLQNSKMAR